METTILIIISIIAAWLFGDYNATIYLMYFGGQKNKSLLRIPELNKKLHFISFWLRVCWWLIISYLALQITLLPTAIFIMLINAVLLWTGYNLIYNWRHGHPWWYIGTKASQTSSWIDLHLQKAVYSGQAFLILLTIFCHAIYHDAQRGNFYIIIIIIIFTAILHLLISFHKIKT
ncbi:MAG: hypothetical protein BWY38_01633 [Ignavibacteria bacterium ADurb.Bin266]|nr:MAG: hypothetical protein BWY38_01633 [Ignavibacteria bacterium ADurb.Bin266]